MNEPPDGRRGARSWFGRVARALSGERGEPWDRASLVRTLRDAEHRDVLGPDALAMIEGALSVGDMQVRDIMVPRVQMAVIEGDKLPEEFVGAVVESGHSRFPVIGDNRDEVEGILFAKDLLTYFARNGDARFDLADAMRPAVFIPESKRLDVLLREFRASRSHMAVVVDEYGGRVRSRHHRGRAGADRGGRSTTSTIPATSVSSMRTPTTSSRSRPTPRSRTSTNISGAPSTMRSPTPSGAWCCARSLVFLPVSNRLRSMDSASPWSAPTSAVSICCGCGRSAATARRTEPRSSRFQRHRPPEGRESGKRQGLQARLPSTVRSRSAIRSGGCDGSAPIATTRSKRARRMATQASRRYAMPSVSRNRTITLA